MLVCPAVKPSQCFPHHIQLRLAVPFENSSIALTEHLGNKMIRNTARAQPCGERVP
jgi:hypothetical protein